MSLTSSRIRHTGQLVRKKAMRMVYSQHLTYLAGITFSKKLKKFFWTQKGHSKGGDGRIFSAGLDMPAGQTAKDRTDVEVVV